MNVNPITWRLWAVAFVAVTLVWFAGLIPSFWFGVGTVALALLFSYLQRLPTRFGRRVAITLIVGAVIVAVGLPAFRGWFITNYPKLAYTTLRLQDHDTELISSELGTPLALELRRAYQERCNKVRRDLSRKFEAWLKAQPLPSDPKSPHLPVLPSELKEMRTAIDTIEKYQMECGQYVLRTKAGRVASITSFPNSAEGWFWILGGAMILGLVAGRLLSGVPGAGRVGGALVALAVLTTMLLGLHWVLFRGGWESIRKWDGAASALQVSLGSPGLRAEPDKVYLITFERGERREVSGLVPPCWKWRLGHGRHSWPLRLWMEDGTEKVLHGPGGHLGLAGLTAVSAESGTLELWVFSRAECPT